MPVEYNPLRQCVGKVVYPSKRAGKRAARLLEQHYGRMRAYRCPHCGGVHIGHQPPKKEAA